MAVLTTKQRKALPTASFAGPGRTFPVQDKAHARNALARASQGVKAGTISKATDKKVVVKAQAVLKKDPPAPRMTAMDKHYRAMDDVRTLKNAAEVKADGKRHEAAKNHARSELEILKQVTKK